MLRRACRVSLDFATASKRREIDRLLEAYRGAVNFYVRSLWRTPGKLDGETLARLPAERTLFHAVTIDAQRSSVEAGAVDRLVDEKIGESYRRFA